MLLSPVIARGYSAGKQTAGRTNIGFDGCPDTLSLLIRITRGALSIGLTLGFAPL
jgi:hypothetical protein